MRSGKLFSPGLLASVANSILDHSDHATSFDTCAKHDPKFVQSAPPAIKPRLLMIIAEPIVGDIARTCSGLFAWIGSKIMRLRQGDALERIHSGSDSVAGFVHAHVYLRKSVKGNAFPSTIVPALFGWR